MQQAATSLMAREHSPFVDDVRQWKMVPEVQFCQRSAVCPPFTSHCCKRDTAL